ncbi:MAG: hypothetical protein N4A61_15775 [Pelagimonas sp.]|nr:hypothetical protein [Pelagimonas sp.]
MLKHMGAGFMSRRPAVASLGYSIDELDSEIAADRDRVQSDLQGNDYDNARTADPANAGHGTRRRWISEASTCRFWTRMTVAAQPSPSDGQRHSGPRPVCGHPCEGGCSFGKSHAALWVGR